MNNKNNDEIKQKLYDELSKMEQKAKEELYNEIYDIQKKWDNDKIYNNEFYATIAAPVNYYSEYSPVTLPSNDIKISLDSVLIENTPESEKVEEPKKIAKVAKFSKDMPSKQKLVANYEYSPMPPAMPLWLESYSNNKPKVKLKPEASYPSDDDHTVIQQEDMDDAQYEALEDVKVILKDYITEFYGERCPDYNPGCLNCIKWKAFDLILDDNYPSDDLKLNDNLDIGKFYNKKWPKNTQQFTSPTNNSKEVWKTHILPDGSKIGPYRCNSKTDKSPYEVLAILEEQGSKYLSNLIDIKNTFKKFPE